jgi:hypothetical protein
MISNQNQFLAQRATRKSTYYQLYLSTRSLINPPTDLLNLANINFNVNWLEIFGTDGSHPQQVFITGRLITESNTNFTWLNNKGTVRLNLPCPYQNQGNGMNLGNIVPVLDPTTIQTLNSSFSSQTVITNILLNSFYVTVTTSSLLFAGAQVTIIGASIGNLTAGVYYVASIINGTIISLVGFTATSTASGYMTALVNSQISTPSNYLLCDTTQNTSSQQINVPRGLATMNIQILNSSEVLQTVNSHWELFLYMSTSKDMYADGVLPSF